MNDKQDINLEDEFLGKTIAEKYVVRRHLGSGNFGSVFVAEQTFEGQCVRKVAIKITKQTTKDVLSASELFGDAFLLGQVAAESFDSRGKRYLMNLYDLGIMKEFENRCYIVMEYIEGRILSDHIRSLKKCPVRTGIRWAKQLCRGLSVLHNLNPPVVHRDLKPDNVIISANDEMRIIDFGLACRLDRITGFSLGAVGEIHHMAPEVLLNQALCASDIFSVGLLLYELFSGLNPYEADLEEINLPEDDRRRYQFELRHKKILRSLCSLNNEIDDGLEGIIFKCLKPNPEERFANAQDLLEAFEEWETAKKRDTREVHFKAGKDLFAHGRYAEALGQFLKVLNARPVKQDRLLFRTCWQSARCHLRLRAFDKCVTYLKEAESLNDQHVFISREELAELYQDLATAYREQGNIIIADNYKQRADRLL